MNKLSFKSYLQEDINDVALFKALFVGGIPGAGKSYTISKITDGAIGPRIVNTDKFIEFLSSKYGIPISVNTHKDDLKAIIDSSLESSRRQLSLYLSAMLPMIIDSTSNSIANLLRRKGQLESVGYDTCMVWVNTSLETALARAKTRDRHVDPGFIKQVHDLSEENKEFYKSKFDLFIEINNDDGDLTDAVIDNSHKAAKKFFMDALHNPVGRRHIEELKRTGHKKLVPSIYSMDNIANVVNSWYFHQ